ATYVAGAHCNDFAQFLFFAGFATGNRKNICVGRSWSRGHQLWAVARIVCRQRQSPREDDPRLRIATASGRAVEDYRGDADEFRLSGKHGFVEIARVYAW